ncbi:hypothetical protein [Campylobacter gastrosuis]|uniref:Uncharacterized protein n=1 Tax=Campylobacter gastrosuis TaxID=2974576 RepID=A0ABT7HP55_9BACT|nr:hypothetical protein [Campylobacter gastrosuis]MDL0088671.1 hypothetical protein [Campylobacter gastrosuis]
MKSKILATALAFWGKFGYINKSGKFVKLTKRKILVKIVAG